MRGMMRVSSNVCSPLLILLFPTQTYTAPCSSTDEFMLQICMLGASKTYRVTKLMLESSLASLVGFVLKLRNLGVPDHGLIRELSSPLAGSLYSGEGHSRIYEEDEVYEYVAKVFINRIVVANMASLAVQFSLETTSLPVQPVIQRPVTPSANMNPYILPFAMRGLLEEEYVRTDLYKETQELLKQFDNWKPSTKALKDVKFRLEGIRSKL